MAWPITSSHIYSGKRSGKALYHYREALKCDNDPQLDFLHKSLQINYCSRGKGMKL